VQNARARHDARKGDSLLCRSRLARCGHGDFFGTAWAKNKGTRRHAGVPHEKISSPNFAVNIGSLFPTFSASWRQLPPASGIAAHDNFLGEKPERITLVTENIFRCARVGRRAHFSAQKIS